MSTFSEHPSFNASIYKKEKGFSILHSGKMDLCKKKLLNGCYAKWGYGLALFWYE